MSARKPTTPLRSASRSSNSNNAAASGKNTSRPANSSAASRTATFTTLELPSAGQHLQALAETGRTVTYRQMQAGLELTAGNMERMTSTMMKNFEEMTGTNKEMFDAYVSYCTTWTKGCEEISKTCMSTMQNMAQQWMQCCKTMLTAKTMKEAMDTQGDFMRTQFDTALAESTKISELCVKLATEASEPMQSQWNQMVSKYNKAA